MSFLFLTAIWGSVPSSLWRTVLLSIITTISQPIGSASLSPMSRATYFWSIIKRRALTSSAIRLSPRKTTKNMRKKRMCLHEIFCLPAPLTKEIISGEDYAELSALQIAFSITESAAEMRLLSLKRDLPDFISFSLKSGSWFPQTSLSCCRCL